MARDDFTGIFDAVVVGAGFAGMYMLHRLRDRGITACVLEAGAGVGGTWYWNRYPGARCDVESLDYQYFFSDALQAGWTWSERYAGQDEILRYQNYVCDALDLRRDIRFDTRVMSAAYDEPAGRWTVETDRGDRISAQFCIMATGCLSAAVTPEVAGVGDFAGEIYHTGRWPHEPVDFDGKRVAVIGTGSSAVQAIPVIARAAKSLTVFQRTPNFSLPAYNRPLAEEETAKRKAEFPAYRRLSRTSRSGGTHPVGTGSIRERPREDIFEELEARWRLGGFAFLASFTDIMTEPESNEIAAQFVRGKIRAVVDDPAIADLLTPHGHPIGAKRLCLDTSYFETFNQPHVKLVDVRRERISRITAGGVLAGDTEYGADTIIFATGFDAMTGALTRIDIAGRDGLKLKDKWRAGPRTYLGLSTAGFPNLFMITGPGSPSVLTVVIASIEQHVEWIEECIAFLRTRGLATIEADGSAEDAWVEHVNELAYRTLMPQANSWYMGANIPGKPRIFMPYAAGLSVYREICSDVAESNYRGFAMAG